MTQTRLVSLRGLLVAVVALLLVCTAARGQEGGESALRRVIESPEAAARIVDGGEILAAYSPEDGRVPVIVSVVPAMRREAVDWSSEAGRRTWRRSVAEAQFDALTPIPPDNHEVIALYENFPVMTLRVDAAGLELLAAQPGVEAVEPVRPVYKSMAQSLPLIDGLTSRGANGGTGVTIAVLDDGIDYTHPQLGGGGFPNAKVIGGRDIADGDDDPFDPTSPHGTAVAGIAAGDVTSAGSYIGGVAPGARLVALKVFPDGSTSGLSSDVIAAINWCITNQNTWPGFPILVINMSLGGGGYTTVSSCESSNTGYRNAANAAAAAGITLVAASGNDGLCDQIAAPACIGSVISVGAVYDTTLSSISHCVSSESCVPLGASCGTNRNLSSAVSAVPKQVPAYSNTGAILELLAPGSLIATTDIVGSAGYSSGNYVSGFSGTSAATPFVAGAAAVIQSAHRERQGYYLTPAFVRAMLVETGEPIADTKGGGLANPITKPLINIGAALGTIAEPSGGIGGSVWVVR